MQKFTPGPWTLCRTIDGEKTVAFHVAADPHGSLHPVVEYREGKVRAPEEIEANARLISAAPELVEALRDVTQHLHVLSAGEVDDPKAGITGWRECHEAIDRARAALAKATGA